MKIGVLALQGAFIEHIHVLRAIGVEGVEVRLPADLEGLSGLILPGGESTTMRRLIDRWGMGEPIVALARRGAPIFGTCAGMIVLAREIAGGEPPILPLLDVTVERNAFGRQLDSFEAELRVPILGDQPVHGVFIRAPVITRTGPEVDILARLDDGRRLRSRWLFGADGAGSTVRRAAGIGMDVCDYAASGLVALLQPERPHAATCWQRFLPTGPLALLPCADGRVSIVWSLPEPEARRLAAAPAAAFEAELVRAADRVLGGLRLDSERRLFPLRRQLADPPLRGRVALFGDAAHVVHPLAGQGMNLGLRDVAGLFEVLDAARQRGGTLSPARLARWARRRRSENHLAAHAFEAIHRVYSNDAPLPVALRGWALAAANLPPLGRVLWRHAAGL